MYDYEQGLWEISVPSFKFSVGLKLLYKNHFFFFTQTKILESDSLSSEEEKWEVMIWIKTLQGPFVDLDVWYWFFFTS